MCVYPPDDQRAAAAAAEDATLAAETVATSTDVGAAFLARRVSRADFIFTIHVVFQDWGSPPARTNYMVKIK